MGSQAFRPAKLVFLHEGIVPDTWLTMASGCHHEWNEQQFCWQPKKNGWGQTSIERIYATGDCAEILGAEAAPFSAALCVLSIACDLGRISVSERDDMGLPLKKAVEKHRRFQSFLASVFQPSPAFRGDVADDTIVCRCECVTAGEIRQVIKLGSVGPNQNKGFTRAGMGPCQGRLCGLTVTEIYAAQLDQNPTDIGHFRVRPPIKPLTLEELASAGNLEETDFSISKLLNVTAEKY